MKKEEKTRLTYERIMAAAIAEFGEKSYDSASLHFAMKIRSPRD